MNNKVSRDDNWWSRWKIQIIFGISFLIGLLLLWPASLLTAYPILHEITLGLGIAGLIAGIVGGLIEIAFATELAQEVFKAAFGYLLHPEIQKEIEWIYGMPKLATNYRHDYVIKKCDENVCKVWVYQTISRTVKNISNKKQDIKPSLGIQEWFHSEGRSEIIDYEITTKDKSFSLKKGDFSLERPDKGKQRDYIIAIKEKTIGKLARNESYTLVATFKELRPASADDVAFWGVPSLEPYITVKVPNDMDYDITFSSIEKQGKMQHLGSNHWNLPTLLLPDQVIRFRWWSKSDSKNWGTEFDDVCTRTREESEVEK